MVHPQGFKPINLLIRGQMLYPLSLAGDYYAAAAVHLCFDYYEKFMGRRST